MKLSVALLAIATAGSSVSAFTPVKSARTSSSSSSSAIHATIENTKLVPPMKVEDLADSAADYYGKNVQTTYG